MYYPKSQITPNLTTNGGEFLTPDGKPYNGKYFKTSDGKFYSGANTNDKPNIQLTQKTINNQSLNSIESPSPRNQDKFVPLRGSEPVDSNMYLIDSGYYKANPELWNRKAAPRPPKQSYSLPTEEEYENGSFNRFYVRKSNEYRYIEVSLKEYKLFEEQSPIVQFNLYSPIKILWRLKGDKTEVYQVNKTTVLNKERIMVLPGFSNSFRKRFDKYWVE